jgi:hypothetical protein
VLGVQAGIPEEEGLMAAKPRINMRFDGEVLAGLERAVKAGRAANVTAALEEAGRAWLGMPSSAEGGSSSTPGTGGAGRTPARPKQAAASRAKPSGKRKPKAPSPDAKAKAATAAKATARTAAVRSTHLPTCRCPVCRPAGKR